jgi:hypothetical protein
VQLLLTLYAFALVAVMLAAVVASYLLPPDEL